MFACQNTEGFPMKPKKLSEMEIKEALRAAECWRREGEEITRTWKFSGFKEAIDFVNQVAEEADKADHHPDILVQYSKVTLRLSTHDCGGLSDRDFAFASRMDEISQRC